jgi:hypothetical protein
MPGPNRISARAGSAIAGGGLNIAVMVSRKSVPMRFAAAGPAQRDEAIGTPD